MMRRTESPRTAATAIASIDSPNANSKIAPSFMRIDLSAVRAQARGVGSLGWDLDTLDAAGLHRLVLQKKGEDVGHRLRSCTAR